MIFSERALTRARRKGVRSLELPYRNYAKSSAVVATIHEYFRVTRIRGSCRIAVLRSGA